MVKIEDLILLKKLFKNGSICVRPPYPFHECALLVLIEKFSTSDSRPFYCTAEDGAVYVLHKTIGCHKDKCLDSSYWPTGCFIRPAIEQASLY